MAGAIRRAVPSGEHRPLRMLELGAGMGRLSLCLLEEFPQAELTALDISPVMLAECREVLAPFGARATVVAADFATAELGMGYDTAVSRLSIHHLEDDEKQALYRRLFGALVPGGVLVYADLIKGETEDEDGALRAEWRDYMRSRGDDPDEWEAWLVGDGDHPATERRQIAGLEAAGFVEIETIWRRAQFAIIRAMKP